MTYEEVIKHLDKTPHMVLSSCTHQGRVERIKYEVKGEIFMFDMDKDGKFIHYKQVGENQYTVI